MSAAVLLPTATAPAGAESARTTARGGGRGEVFADDLALARQSLLSAQAAGDGAAGSGPEDAQPAESETGTAVASAVSPDPTASLPALPVALTLPLAVVPPNAAQTSSPSTGTAAASVLPGGDGGDASGALPAAAAAAVADSSEGSDTHGRSSGAGPVPAMGEDPASIPTHAVVPTPGPSDGSERGADGADAATAAPAITRPVAPIVTAATPTTGTQSPDEAPPPAAVQTSPLSSASSIASALPVLTDSPSPAPVLAPVPAASGPAPAENVVTEAPASGSRAEPPLTEQLTKPLLTLRGAAHGSHVLTVQVTPDELGPVTVRAHIGADGVRLELIAPTEAARDALRQAAPDLRRDLAAAGMTGDLQIADDATGSSDPRQESGPRAGRSGREVPHGGATAEADIPRSDRVPLTDPTRTLDVFA